jgi:heptosyltransferase-2
MKFLLISLGGIGRTVLTTPVIRCLKQQVKDAELHYLTLPANKIILENNPYIDKLHFFNKNSLQLVDALKELQFDHVIDLQADAASKQMSSQLHLPVLTYRQLKFQSAVFTTLKWNVMPKDLHLVDRFMETVMAFGVENDGKGLDYFIPQQDEVKVNDIPASHQLGYIAMVIGSSKFTKRMTAMKIREFCQAIDHPVMLLGGKEEYQTAEAIASFDPVKIYNACGKFNLNESADLLKKSRLVISHDTGLMQVAAALKKPLIVTWGSTTPSLGATPYYGSHYLQMNQKAFDNIHVNQLWCRPCTTIGRSACPQGHFKCMKKMPVDLLLSGVKVRLAEKNR